MTAESGFCLDIEGLVFYAGKSGICGLWRYSRKRQSKRRNAGFWFFVFDHTKVSENQKKIKNMKEFETSSRRSFIGKSVALASTLALPSLAFKPCEQDNTIEEGLYMIGPRKGYTPLIGTLISMLENMTSQVKATIKNFTMEELDYQFDKNANTIGALILHITSSEKFHQIGTLENRPLNEEELKFWFPARNLSHPSSKTIRGNEIEYYLQIMDEVRKDSLAGLKEKDDTWLLSLDETISTPETPINKFWRWFHACEHMSNHNGQIKFLKSRLPLNKKD